MERQREIERLSLELDALVTPGWRFLFALDENNPEALQECAELERQHYEQHKEEIARLRNRIRELE